MRERRLHHAAVGAEALSGLRGIAIPLVVLAVVGGGGADRIVFFGLLGLAFAVVTAFVAWQTTRWSYGDGEVRLRRGLFSERITSVPFDRVQSIDTVRGPVQRLFGVVELHVQSAGGGSGGEIVLKAVTPADAAELRAAVADEADEPGAEPAAAAAEDPERSLTLSTRSLIVAALTSGSLAVLLPVVAGASQVLDDVLSEEQAEMFVPETWTDLALIVAAVVGFAWLLSFLGTIVAFAGFRATRDGDRIRIERGVVERRAATVPVARIHAVRIVESPLREPFGLAQVRIESAGYAQEPASAQTLVPIVRRRDAVEVIARLLPELAVPLDVLDRPPPRALRRFVLPPVVAGVVAAAVPIGLFGAVALPALAVPLAAAALGVGRYRAAGWRLDSRLVLRSRRLARTTSVADVHRLQRVTGAQSIPQRRAALGDLEVAVSSGRRLGVRHLERATVDDLVGRLAATAARPG
jgi:putative membrane protein